MPGYIAVTTPPESNLQKNKAVRGGVFCSSNTERCNATQKHRGRELVRFDVAVEREVNHASTFFCPRTSPRARTAIWWRNGSIGPALLTLPTAIPALFGNHPDAPHVENGKFQDFLCSLPEIEPA
eukprot:g73852.t1